MSTIIGAGRGGSIADAGAAGRARTDSVQSTASRNAGIDLLRGAPTLLVLLHHTAITCGANGASYYHDIEPSDAPETVLLTFFCTVNQPSSWTCSF
jgi:hypothetical protein